MPYRLLIACKLRHYRGLRAVGTGRLRAARLALFGPRVILTVKGVVPDEDIAEFRRLWREMVADQGLT